VFFGEFAAKARVKSAGIGSASIETP
jgi:hypothetical protein